MAVWNGDAYLSEAIESILSQTFQDFELVVVDDGSWDGSREIVSRYAQQDTRVRAVFAAHRGLVASLNDGCQTARGRYLARLDSDDVSLPARLEQQVRFLESHPHVALVGTAFQSITATGHRTASIIYPPFDNAGIRQRLRVANCFCHSTVMMRADAFARVGGYRGLCTEAQDYDLWLRLGDRHELANLPWVLVLYRIHPRQVSLTRAERQALVAIAARAATEIRRRTGVDPLAHVEVIDEAVVRGLGVSDGELEAHIITAYVNCLAAMPQLGLGKAALDALREVAAHPSLIAQLQAM